jgi:catechol 2,3-dioxygenase-like lactoylglutathione lyase family enzyme
MLSGFDHVVVAVEAIEPGIEAYRTLLGRAPAWRAAGEGGVAVAMFTLANITIELMAPVDDGPVAERLRAVLAAPGEGLASVSFATADLAEAHRRFTRVGLSPEPIAEADSFDAFTGRVRKWKRTRVASAAAGGLRLFVLERDLPLPASPPDVGVALEAATMAVDHIVVHTANPERAAAMFGARLGLDLRMDQAFPDWGARLQFFRCGDAILEVASETGGEVAAQNPDRLYGLTYRVPSAASAHARLTAAGLDLSPVRDGRKAGTKVFTVRNRTCGVPTLMLQGAGAKDDR